MVIFHRFLVGLPGRVSIETGHFFSSTFSDPSTCSHKWVPLVSTIYGYDTTHAVRDIYIYMYVYIYIYIYMYVCMYVSKCECKCECKCKCKCKCNVRYVYIYNTQKYYGLLFFDLAALGGLPGLASSSESFHKKYTAFSWPLRIFCPSHWLLRKFGDVYIYIYLHIIYPYIIHISSIDHPYIHISSM